MREEGGLVVNSTIIFVVAEKIANQYELKGKRKFSSQTPEKN